MLNPSRARLLDARSSGIDPAIFVQHLVFQDLDQKKVETIFTFTWSNHA